MNYVQPPTWMRGANAPALPVQPPAAPVLACPPPAPGLALTPYVGSSGGDYIVDVFGPTGYLAQRLPGYAQREGQVAFAHAVDVAIRNKRHLLAEAAVGIGKSFAYLVPATHYAVANHKRILIVTAGIALQEQLVRKDLPFLVSILPWKFTYGLIKGRGNYLCQATRISAKLGGDKAEVAQISRWAATTQTGDVSELPFKPAPHVWRKFSVSGDDCPKAECSHFDSCFAERAHLAAKRAQVVVTNYHMFLAHLAVQEKTGGQVRILPEYDVVIGDELHALADTARSFFGFSLTQSSIKWATRLLNDIGSGALATQVEDRSDRFFNELRAYRRQPVYKARLRGPSAVHWLDFCALLNQTAEVYRLGAKTNTTDLAPHLKLASNRCTAIAQQITAAMMLTDPRTVYFLEEDEKTRVSLNSKPLDVSAKLNAGLFGITPTVVGCSATLAVGGSFDHCKHELGATDRVDTLLAGTPFDLVQQMRLILPKNLPSPADREWTDAAVRAFADVIDAAGGRTLGLFTSHKMLNKVAESLATYGCRWRILKQGDLPPTQLIEEFRRDTNSVLIGTATFWTGVDVPGESLSCVVVDRLPFPNPEDPVLDAISAFDRNSFMNYSIPRAVIAFKQGTGRLIRSATDRGVVVVLDNRIRDKGYGPRHFLSVFPPGILASDDIHDIAEFLGTH